MCLFPRGPFLNGRAQFEVGRGKIKFFWRFFDPKLLEKFDFLAFSVGWAMKNWIFPAFLPKIEPKTKEPASRGANEQIWVHQKIFWDPRRAENLSWGLADLFVDFFSNFEDFARLLMSELSIERLFGICFIFKHHIHEFSWLFKHFEPNLYKFSWISEASEQNFWYLRPARFLRIQAARRRAKID